LVLGRIVRHGVVEGRLNAECCIAERWQIDPESRHITQNIYLREVVKADDGTYINKEVQTFEKQGDPRLAADK
ncbi:hypothetical protein ACCS78_35765, partial [Rhizobium johnstonii]